MAGPHAADCQYVARKGTRLMRKLRQDSAYAAAAGRLPAGGAGAANGHCGQARFQSVIFTDIAVSIP